MKKMLVLLVMVLTVFSVSVGNELLGIVMDTMVSVVQKVGYDPLLDYDIYTEHMVILVPLGGPVLDKFTEGLSYDDKIGLNIYSMYFVVAVAGRSSLYVPLNTVAINGNPVFMAYDMNGNLVSDIYISPGNYNHYILASLGKAMYPTITWRGRHIDPFTSVFFMSLLETFGT